MKNVHLGDLTYLRERCCQANYQCHYHPHYRADSKFEPDQVIGYYQSDEQKIVNNKLLIVKRLQRTASKDLLIENDERSRGTRCCEKSRWRPPVNSRSAHAPGKSHQY